MEDAFAKSADQVLANFEVNVKSGLKDHQVKALREKWGSNGMSSRHLADKAA